MARNPEPEQLGYCRYCHCGGGHIPGCPEYEAQPVSFCEICNEDVFAGEPYIVFQSHSYHTECFLEKYEHKD